MTNGPDSNLGVLIGVVLSGILAARIWAASPYSRRNDPAERAESPRQDRKTADGYARQ